MNALIAVVVFWLLLVTVALTFTITLQVAVPAKEHVTTVEKSFQPLK